jgi:hypothetical protein
MGSCYETALHRLGAGPFPNDCVSRSPSSRGAAPIVAPRLPGHPMQRQEALCSIAAVAVLSPAAKATIPCQRKLIKRPQAGFASDAVWPRKLPRDPRGFSGSSWTKRSCGRSRPPTGQWCCERRPYPGASDGIRSAFLVAAGENGMNGPEEPQPTLNISLQ